MKEQKHCHGCGYSFESYNMTQAQGYDYQGSTYCNSDCQMESEVDALESEMYMSDCGLNSDGSEWA